MRDRRSPPRPPAARYWSHSCAAAIGDDTLRSRTPVTTGVPYRRASAVGATVCSRAHRARPRGSTKPIIDARPSGARPFAPARTGLAPGGSPCRVRVHTTLCGSVCPRSRRLPVARGRRGRNWPGSGRTGIAPEASPCGSADTQPARRAPCRDLRVVDFYPGHRGHNPKDRRARWWVLGAEAGYQRIADGRPGAEREHERRLARQPLRGMAGQHRAAAGSGRQGSGGPPGHVR